jgi:hypothetical protein
VITFACVVLPKFAGRAEVFGQQEAGRKAHEEEVFSVSACARECVLLFAFLSLESLISQTTNSSMKPPFSFFFLQAQDQRTDLDSLPALSVWLCSCDFPSGLHL